MMEAMASEGGSAVDAGGELGGTMSYAAVKAEEQAAAGAAADETMTT